MAIFRKNDTNSIVVSYPSRPDIIHIANYSKLIKKIIIAKFNTPISKHIIYNL